MAETLFIVAAGIALIALVISFFRLIAGPTGADRAVALDAMTIISVSLIAFLAYYFRKAIYLDVAMVYGLVSFIGVLALARYLERGL